jgi:internalin A
LSGLLLFGRCAVAQVVSIPDPNLEAAVRNALQVQAPTNIYVTNMLTLTNFSAGYRGIQDLTGLEAAANLTVLDLNGNQVQNFNALTGTTYLVEFHIANNQLTSLSGVSLAKSVLSLEVSGNQLTNFNGLSGMTNLLRVSATGNPMVTLAGIETAVNLTNLDAGFCQITNIAAVSNLTKMARLQLGWNHFWDPAPLYGLTNMVWLDIGGNRGPGDIAITNAGFIAGMKNLKWLSLYYLRVADFGPLAGRSSLTNLDAGWNASPANVSVLAGLTNLILLHLTADNISSISFASQMPLLRDIDFGNNSVTDLSPLLGKSLTTLMAQYNPLTNAALVSTFPNLERLSVGGLSLTSFSLVSGLTHLTELWVDGNPGVASVTPILGLTNLTHLNVNGNALTNLPAIGALYNLNNLEMNYLSTPASLSFLGQLTNLNSLDLGGDHLGDISPLAGLPDLHTLYLNDNVLSDISPLLSISSFNYYGYIDLRGNILDLTPTSAAWNVITNLQANYISVDWNPQNVSSTIQLWASPVDQCVTNNGAVYFAVSATTTAGTLQIQWQFNGVDLPGQTAAALYLSSVHSNQAGLYRAVLHDDNGNAASGAAHLYVGDPNCGRTVFITRQPQNQVGAPGEDVYVDVQAISTYATTNLNFQWRFNGVDIPNATDAELYLPSVSGGNAGLYQVLVWDATSNVVASVAAQVAVIDVVPFGSASFSNMVYAALVDQGHTPSGVIHLSDLDHLNYFYMNSAGITNISGLQYSRNLYSVDLGNNPIADPSPLAWLNAVQYLYLSGCGLQDASFVSRLYNLQQLYLNENSIHSIPVLDGLNELTDLQINNNGCLINSPRLAVLTNLLLLALHSDCLPDIEFCAGMPLLQLLDVGGDWQFDEKRNTVSDISPLIGKTQLNWLSLAWDQVTNVPVITAFTNLEHLFLSSNHFDNINFVSNMPALQEFTINVSLVTNISALASHTPLYNLDVSYIATSDLTAVAGLTNLNTLWCGGNHASGGGSYLNDLANLQVLGCEMNNLADLSFMAGMPRVYYANLEYNAVTNVSLLAGRTNLNYLFLSGNQVRELAPVGTLTNLYSLSLAANGLTNIAPLSTLRALQWLQLQSNHVQTVSALATLGNSLGSLDISANEVADISPVTNLHKLTWFGPWLNRLTSLPSLAGLSNVTSMDFWGNQLTNVSGVSGMQSLNWLGLSRNHLTTIQPLSNLPSLTTLDLYTNQITDVSGLAGLTTLLWLNLNDNNLQVIDPLTSLVNLNYVDLRGNLLNTNAGSAAMANIAILRSHHTYVDYIPQKGVFLFDPVKLGPAQFRFSIQGGAGTTLEIWSSTNLATWSSIGFLTNTNGTATFTDTSATNAVKSYRVKQL